MQTPSQRGRETAAAEDADLSAVGEIVARIPDVVPAKAGTHSLRPIRMSAGGDPWHSTSHHIGIGGYGSPPSRGRRKRMASLTLAAYPARTISRTRPTVSSIMPA